MPNSTSFVVPLVAAHVAYLVQSAAAGGMTSVAVRRLVGAALLPMTPRARAKIECARLNRLVADLSAEDRLEFWGLLANCCDAGERAADAEIAFDQ